MHSFKTKTKLFYCAQYGFRTGHSTGFAALELVDRIILNIDKMETPIGIFLDLFKAFDTLDHEILLNKLNVYGFHGTALKLMKSYSTDHKQFVQVDNTKSDFLTITTEVPQGSILGPLLFIIYINDIAQSSNLFWLYFICYIYTSLTTTCEIIYKKGNKTFTLNILNHELTNINDLLKLNNLSLNIKKIK